MSLTENSGMYMPVAPAYGYGYGNGNSGGFGNGFGGDGWWILLLFLLLGNNGWGGLGGFGFGGGAGELYPWMNQSNQISDGFRDQMLSSNISAIQSGVNNISSQLCNGFAGVNANVCNGFSQAEIANNARQIANMQTAFAGQTAMAQGFNLLGSQFADCCCENRLASADLKYTIATENCADRQTINEGVRDIIANQTAGTQRILDQLCADKIDAKNEKIADLERQLTMANLQASQVAQTAQIQRGQNDATAALVNELRSCPIPSQPVYGSQPIFTCPVNVNGGNGGCGCGCGSF